MGNEASTQILHKTPAAQFHSASARSKKNLLSRWQSRSHETQLFAVVRHAERADGIFAFWEGSRWTQSDDFHRWPLDPPLSDAGQVQAEGIGSQLGDFAARKRSNFQVVVTSPYFRCVQTAVKICKKLGPEVKLLVDLSLGEVFGPSVLGEAQPRGHVRSLHVAATYCAQHGVKCIWRAIGQSPVWPESLNDARRRYALRFLSYLQRGATARRNFVLVTHADCVGSVLGILPDKKDVVASKVDYGASILASRNGKGSASSSSHLSRHVPRSNFSAVLPLTAEEEEAIVLGQADEVHLGDREAGVNLPQLAEMSEKEGGGGVSPLAEPDLPPPKEEAAVAVSAKDSAGEVMFGWKSETLNLNFSMKRSKGKFSKRVAALVQSGMYSWDKIEKLLGEMGHRPLGESIPTQVPLPESSGTSNTLQSNLSLSTYLFGGSDQGEEQMSPGLHCLNDGTPSEPGSPRSPHPRGGKTISRLSVSSGNSLLSGGVHGAHGAGIRTPEVHSPELPSLERIPKRRVSSNVEDLLARRSSSVSRSSGSGANDVLLVSRAAGSPSFMSEGKDGIKVQESGQIQELGPRPGRVSSWQGQVPLLCKKEASPVASPLPAHRNDPPLPEDAPPSLSQIFAQVSKDSKDSKDTTFSAAKAAEEPRGSAAVATRHGTNESKAVAEPQENEAKTNENKFLTVPLKARGASSLLQRRQVAGLTLNGG